MLIWMGYSETDINASKRRYINILKEKFKEDIDYKLINNKEFHESSKCSLEHLENKEINTHNKTKHLIVSPDCFKYTLMLIRTEKADKVREYYIELEKIFKFYLEYQNQYQLKQLEFKLEEEKEKNNNQVKMLFNERLLSLNEYIYIATSKNYAEKNIFKIGKTKSFIDRIKSYQMGRIKDDEFSYIFIMKCNNSKVIEQLIFNRLENFQYIDKNGNKMNEMYCIHYQYLEKIMKEFEEFEELNNKRINKILLEYYYLYKDLKLIDLDDIKIQNIEKYIEEKFNIKYKEEDDKFANIKNISKLNKTIINEKLTNYNIQLVNEYSGSSTIQEEFECQTLFKHKLYMTLDHMNRIKSCSLCKKNNILDGIKIYSYNSKTMIFNTVYNNFDDIKKQNPTINYQLIRNNIREKRWLCSIENNIYSILSPNKENKLDLNKDLTEIEKKIIEILEIDYEKMKEKLLNKQTFIYAIDIENKTIYKSNGLTQISRILKHKNGNKLVNRKTIPNYLDKSKKYAGYLWSNNFDIKYKYYDIQYL